MAINDYLNQTVTHYARGSYDGYGREVDGATTVYNARVELFTKQLLLPNGETTLIDGRCFINGNPEISIDDRIDYNSVKYRIFGKKENVDGQGAVHHITLTLQKSTN